MTKPKIPEYTLRAMKGCPREPYKPWLPAPTETYSHHKKIYDGDSSSSLLALVEQILGYVNDISPSDKEKLAEVTVSAGYSGGDGDSYDLTMTKPVQVPNRTFKSDMKRHEKELAKYKADKAKYDVAIKKFTEEQEAIWVPKEEAKERKEYLRLKKKFDKK